MRLSVVTTLFNSGKYIQEFYTRMRVEIAKITEDYEIIFVNDGSTDDSLTIALELKAHDTRIKVLDLSRNFGHHKAIMTGLNKASGDFIFLIDVDLEEEPELLSRFREEMGGTDDIDVVFGVQKNRKGGLFEKISGSLFFDVFNFISETKIPKNLILARLMSRRYLDSLLEFSETEIVFAGISELAGYNKKELPVEKGYKGETTYSLSRKFRLFLNFITDFTYRPLLLIFYFGLTISILSFGFVVFLIARKILFGLMEGWTSMIASIWLLGGIIILCIGFIGLYLSKIFLEVKNRPRTIIRKIYE
ncbi:MAG TPA: glycosyltransferase family 2 protein [Ignavibacteria bacterium]|nr:glycosyltransferase family 2 protein [Ignavibacteria bacterium]